VDGTLLDAHSPKPGAAGTDKHGYGCSPLVAFLDHGDGTGETVSGILRPGNAGSNTARRRCCICCEHVLSGQTDTS
jgi:hypothetical protein